MSGSKTALVAALAVFLIWCAACESEAASDENSDALSGADARRIPAFSNVARQIMGAAYQIRNYRPGVAIFDFDRDGDWDFYLTQEAGQTNRLFRNDGDLTFTDVAESAGVAAVEQGSSGVVACDVNNDGFQDIYVGGRGVEGDGLDYRSAETGDATENALGAAYADALFINRGDGTFEDATATALGDAVNLRSASTIACADVDLDGWPDIFVANMVDEDYFFLGRSHHPGHFNTMLHNNGDGTFTDVSESAGARGGQIWMRDQQGAAHHVRWTVRARRSRATIRPCATGRATASETRRVRRTRPCSSTTTTICSPIYGWRPMATFWRCTGTNLQLGT